MPGSAVPEFPDDELIADVLPHVQDLAELKAILYVRFLSEQDGRKPVSLERLLEPGVLRATVGLLSPEPAEQRLRRALERAVANGFLFRLAGGPASVDTDVSFLPATRANRELIEEIERGSTEAASAFNLPAPEEVRVDRPNVFSLYEQRIGPLTPLVAEQLRDAERSYPRAWIEEAIMAAEHYNRRSWRYIQSILTRWEVLGGPDRALR